MSDKTFINKGFVLHSLPGIDKAIAITNLIKDTLQHGKSFLFVSEKLDSIHNIKNKLNDIGIGEFSLELHSENIKKNTILEQLEKVLNFKYSNENAEKSNLKTNNSFENLSEIIKELNKPRKINLSIFDCICMYEKNKDVSGEILFSQESIKRIDKDTYEIYSNLIHSLKNVVKECGGIYNNPLMDVKKVNYTMLFRDEMLTNIDEYLSTINGLEINLNKILKLSNSTKNWNQLYNLKLLLDALTASEKLSPALLNDLYKIEFEDYREICTRGREAENITTKLLEIFDEDVLNINAEEKLRNYIEGENSWLPYKYTKHTGINKFLKQYVVNPGKYNKNEIINYLTDIIKYKVNKSYIDENADKVEELFSNCWKGMETNWTVFGKMISDAERIREAIYAYIGSLKERNYVKSLLINEVYSDLQFYQENMQEVKRNLKNLIERKAELETWFKKNLGINFEDNIHATANFFTSIKNKFATFANTANLLEKWEIYLDLKKEAFSLGLEELVSQIENGTIDSDNIVEIFEKSISKALLKYFIDSDIIFEKFRNVSLLRTINIFKEYIDDYEILSKDKIIDTVRKQYENASKEELFKKEIKILKDGLSKKGNISIEELIKEVPTAIRYLCPCILANSKFISQYIEETNTEFDLIVYDEIIKDSEEETDNETDCKLKENE